MSQRLINYFKRVGNPLSSRQLHSGLVLLGRLLTLVATPGSDKLSFLAKFNNPLRFQIHEVVKTKFILTEEIYAKFIFKPNRTKKKLNKTQKKSSVKNFQSKVG